MAYYNWTANAERAIDRGVVDYVNEKGAVICDVPASRVLVRSMDDLALLTDCPPGTAAFTADGKHFWMKAADESWNDWLDDQASAN